MQPPPVSVSNNALEPTAVLLIAVVFDPKAVKSTFNSGTWDTEIANIYKQQTQEILAQRGKQKKGKPVPQAVYQIARIVENFDFAASKPFATNRDFKLEIQNRIKAEAKKAKAKDNVNINPFIFFS